MRLVKGTSFASENLAEALQDDEGTFLCQHRGQNYIVESAAGHSIVSGPTPVGPAVAVAPSALNVGPNPEPWTITKLDDRPIGFRQHPGEMPSRSRREIG